MIDLVVRIVVIICALISLVLVVGVSIVIGLGGVFKRPPIQNDHQDDSD